MIPERYLARNQVIENPQTSLPRPNDNRHEISYAAIVPDGITANLHHADD